MGVYDDLSKLDSKSPAPRISDNSKTQKQEKRKNKITTDQSKGKIRLQPTSRTTNRPVDQLVNRLVSRLTNYQG
jgi:hypothetical protein